MNGSEARSPRNRTLVLDEAEYQRYCQQLVTLDSQTQLETLQPCLDKTLHQPMESAIACFPAACIDLLIVDPPYNRRKNYNGRVFASTSAQTYQAWLHSWFSKLVRLLKPTASVYVCCDWQSSAAVAAVLEQFLILRNRITWEREKGRGAQYNWKNAAEDIWFATPTQDYYFNVEAVKLKRRVLAPYRSQGHPKDWQEDQLGRFRLTCPSNLWTDISVPFWSMPENTDHPTQKPEKLFAKLILASSRPGEVVLDPFLGSGTTSVVAKKLGRHYVGIEREERYCCWAEKRLAQAETDPRIQGYAADCFWERNTSATLSQARSSQ